MILHKWPTCIQKRQKWLDTALTAGNFVAWPCQPTIPVFRAGIYGLAVQLDGLLKVVLLEEHVPFQLDLKRGLKGGVCHPQSRKRKVVSSATRTQLGVLPRSGRCAAGSHSGSLPPHSWLDLGLRQLCRCSAHASPVHNILPRPRKLANLRSLFMSTGSLTEGCEIFQP